MPALELAGLVREGRSNREIAGAIFVSEKTVERQLSRIFRKLDIAGQTILATIVAAAEADLREGPPLT